MKTQDLKALHARGEATIATHVLSPHALRDIAAAAFSGREEELFIAPRGLEHGPAFLLRFRTTRNTVFAPVVSALLRQRVPVDANIASLAKCLGVTRKQLHDEFCSCHEASGITGLAAQIKFKFLGT